MATLRAASRAGSVIPKCRHQSTATTVIDATAAGDEAAALPFEDIPTFKTTKWPLVGQLRQLTKIEPELYKKYGFAKGYKLMDGVRGLTGGRLAPEGVRWGTLRGRLPGGKEKRPGEHQGDPSVVL